MPGRVLLDTSVLVDLLRGDRRLEPRLREADELFTSVVAIGELLYGVRRSRDPQENREKVEAFSSGVSVLAVDGLTAEAYSRLKDALRRKGRPIPDNDLWIAATAAQHGLQLASRDQHFSELDQLSTLDW